MEQARNHRQAGPLTVDLAHAAYGAGPPLVILHGLFGNSRNWETVAKRLAEGRLVLVPDLRNHGRSPWADAMGYAALADDVAAFIARHVEGPVALLGHSMGGKTAMLLALQRPELVERLIVVDIAPVAYPTRFRSYVDAMRGLDLAALARRADADAQLARTVAEPGVRAFLLQNLVAEHGGFRWRLNLAALDRALDDLADFPELPADVRYAGPSLFLHGSRSDYVRPADAAAIRRRFPAARIVAIPEAGHWVHAEQPAALIAAAQAFLAA